MNKETQIIIAFVFNRAGKKEMTFSEFYLTLSMELKWFTPDDAKAFTKNALQNNLLNEKNENITPGFQIDEIKIPLGFYPSEEPIKQSRTKKEVVEKIQEESFLDDIIEKIVEKSSLDKETIIEQIKKIKREKNITIEIAAVLIAKEYSLVFDDLLDKIEKTI